MVIDAVARLKEGVLGNGQSAVFESFEGGLLDHPQYTRPADFSRVEGAGGSALLGGRSCQARSGSGGSKRRGRKPRGNGLI